MSNSLQPSEVQFFAATTLHMKVMKNWSEVPIEHYNDLKKRLLQAIVNYATGPKIVLNRLCIAVSAFKTILKHTHRISLNLVIQKHYLKLSLSPRLL